MPFDKKFPCLRKPKVVQSNSLLLWCTDSMFSDSQDNMANQTFSNALFEVQEWGFLSNLVLCMCKDELRQRLIDFYVATKFSRITDYFM